MVTLSILDALLLDFRKLKIIFVFIGFNEKIVTRAFRERTTN